MHIGKSPGAKLKLYNGNFGVYCGVDKTDFEKDLGIWITSSLKPSLHCDKTAAAATRILGMLKRMFTKFSTKSLIFLNKTYTRTQLEHILHPALVSISRQGH